MKMSLKIEDGAICQGMLVASKGWKDHEINPPPARASEANATLLMSSIYNAHIGLLSAKIQKIDLHCLKC